MTRGFSDHLDAEPLVKAAGLAPCTSREGSLSIDSACLMTTNLARDFAKKLLKLFEKSVSGRVLLENSVTNLSVYFVAQIRTKMNSLS